MTTIQFPTDTDLLTYAELFCSTRANSLYTDVTLCFLPFQLKDQRLSFLEYGMPTVWPMQLERYDALGFKHDQPLQVALFPAVFACCSSIELFAGLVAGNLKHPNTGQKQSTSSFVRFLSTYANYPEGKAFLLEQIVRHKIAHLSMPAPVAKTSVPITFEDNQVLPKGSVVTWEFGYGGFHAHLDVAQGEGTMNGPVGPLRISDLVRFNINIDRLLVDTIQAVVGPNGYLAKLKSGSDPDLLRNFETAINHLFIP